MKPLPLFGTGLKSLAAAVTAQERINCFYDIREDGDRANIIVRGTPGSDVVTVMGDYPIRGFHVIGSLLYVVSGASVYTVDGGGNQTLLGTIGTNSGYVDMDDDSVSLVIADGSIGYTVTLPSGPPIAMVDANFPTGATSLAVLNSTTYVALPNTRTFVASQKLSAGGYTPYTFGTKENTSDNLVRVMTYQGSLALFGEKSIEFWQDVGSSPLALQRVTGASQDWGLAAKYSLARAMGTIFFLGQNPQGGVQVMRLNGYTPIPVSTSDIENRISSFASYTDAVAMSYVVDGHPMYQITFPNAQVSFIFDGKTGMWSTVQTGVAPVARHIANLGVVFNSRNYFSDITSGNLYRLNTSTYTDAGTPIKRVIASRHVRMNGNEFSVSEIKLEMQTGVGLSSGQGSDPQIIMQISRDGGNTYGPERWKSIGQIGQFLQGAKWDRCGSGVDFVFKFTLTDPVKFVIAQAVAMFEPGSEAGE